MESGWEDTLFVDADEGLLSQLRCSICYGIMRNASQCVQQHPFCHNCLVKAVELNRRYGGGRKGKREAKRTHALALLCTALTLRLLLRGED